MEYEKNTFLREFGFKIESSLKVIFIVCQYVKINPDLNDDRAKTMNFEFDSFLVGKVHIF